MDKNKKILSKRTARIRGWIQAAATLLTNIHIPNLLRVKYIRECKNSMRTRIKLLLLPRRDRSLPNRGISGSCRIIRFKFSYYITGFFILLGVTLGDLYVDFCVHLDGFRIYFIKSREKIFHGPTEATKIPEISYPYCFRYTSANVCNELHWNGGSVLL